MARINNVRVKLCDKILLKKIDTLNKAVLQINNGDGPVKEYEMEMAFKQSINYSGSNFFSHRLDDAHISIIYIIIFLILLFFATPILVNVLEILISMRCIVPNNYLVWEATRPVSNCDFCRGIDKPTILKNLTREEFKVKSITCFFLQYLIIICLININTVVFVFRFFFSHMPILPSPS